MGKHSDSILARSLAANLILSFAFCGSSHASTITSPEHLSALRTQISVLEKDLLDSESSRTSAATQLKKIKRLIGLQQKEITLTKKKIKDFDKNLESLAEQKQVLLQSIDAQKKQVRDGLKELYHFTEPHVLDARWLKSMDEFNQKNYFLSKILKKGTKNIGALKVEITQALALELKMLEEKNQQEYHANELEEQVAQLRINEDVHREILKSNKVSHLEAFKKIQLLKESEKELQDKIAKRKQLAQESSENLMADSALIKMKGRLPFPVRGEILNSFGKFFDSKTNLLTFHKGITLGSSPSTDVKAIYPGKVVFAGPLKNYGLVTIIEHPGQYYSLYGQMGDLSIKEGVEVEQGEVLGKTSSVPLYFEIRDKNVAINPVSWLVSSGVALTKQN